MPNWCQGSLKIRGKLENIQKFIENGLELNVHEYHLKNEDWVDRVIPTDEWLKKDIYDGNTIHYYGSTSSSNLHTIWVRDSHRAFVDFIEISPLICPADTNDSLYYTYMSVKQAWEIRSEDWLAIAKKYEVDIRLYGIESGAGFTQTVEIINGEITVDEITDYKNYADFIWKCPLPWIGG